MPQSIRDQIMAAIARAGSEQERAVLLLLLQIFDLWAENTAALTGLERSVTSLVKAHEGIEPDDHKTHHRFVDQQIPQAEDRRIISRGLIEKVLWSAISGGAVFFFTRN